MGGIDYYFDVSSMIVGVVSVGRYFEHTAKINATSELNTIINNWSLSEVRVIRNGNIIDIHVDELKPNDKLLIKEGESVPVNGEIVKGQAAIDESLITGEPFPVSRTLGEKVLGGVTIVEGEIELTIGDKIVSQVENLSHIFRSMQSSASGSTSIVDKIARIFVPLVLFLAFTVTTIMILNGVEVGFALLAGMTTLIVSCPCTFGLATPLTIAHTISKGLENKIIFTSGDIFEKSNKYSTIAFDKTGTLSAGQMSVIDCVGESIAIDNAAAIEQHCSHPIAKVISKLGPERDISNLEIYPGKGASADIEGLNVAVGSRELLNLFGWKSNINIEDKINKYKTDKYVISYVGWEGKIHGAIVTQDKHRSELETFIKDLRVDRKVVLLTGSEHSSGYEKYVDECYTGIPPEAKEAVIRQLRNKGENVIMVGDGSNDAPALASADLGIAFGVPTALAAEAADLVIPGKDLNRVQLALGLITITKRRIRQNISWAFLYNAIAIPLAITGQLNPLLAALAMTSSSLLVVWNSSRPLEDEFPNNET
jgi:Cu2+-exporting ATPase